MPLRLPSMPADGSVSTAILISVATATVTAATCFLVYKSHFYPRKRNPSGKIMFVSRLGFTPAVDLAKGLCNMLESKGLILEVVDARNYDPGDLPKENLILLVHSSSRLWSHPAITISDYTNDSRGAKDFASWLVHNAKNFGIGAVVVKATLFTLFVVGKRDGKNLMAKAANHFRDLNRVIYDSDFEEWWGSVVATVSGDTAANDMCGESEPEDDIGCSDPKSIYMLVENVDLVDRSRTFRRRMLILKNGSVDLEDGGSVTAQWPLADDLIINSKLPTFQGFCALGGSLFIAGGIMCNLGPNFNYELENEHLFPVKVWRLKYDGSTWIWSLCGSMFHKLRKDPIVVPYHGRLCIFGGDIRDTFFARWVEIYNPKLDLWEKREVSLEWSQNPNSYFLWEYGKKPHMKTVIVFYFSFGKHQWLFSYDFEANLWEKLSWELPAIRDSYPRKLIRLAGSDYLLIVDSAAMWYIYDSYRKILVADLRINGMEELIGPVSYVFCCHYTSKEILICVFMELDKKVVEEHGGDPDLVPYARVKLQIDDGCFSAKIENKGYLEVGPYSKIYMFVVGDQDTE